MLTLFIIGMGITPSISTNADPIAFREVKNIAVWDVENDSSFQKFLDKQHPFSNLFYQPNDLEPIVSDFTYNDSKQYQLRKDAGYRFSDMARHFWHDFNGKKRLSITTAYRSYKTQKYLLENYCRNKMGQCAEAGASEHQAGLALDLGVNGKNLDKESFKWLQENAHKRGFHNTYQKGIEIDGQIIEPWHWRYIGVDLAKELYEKKLSFAERYYLEKKK